ncbi:MAG TPA: hypothetical protein VHS53_14815 [Mucilaginibacter sp.]|jgi:hypothetical protein|nr:hypothetical protein [Mucilaginibacter sp.]
MKYILILITMFLSCSSFAQQMNYQEFRKEAKTNIRLLPEYGNAVKTPEQIAADNELINIELKQNGTHRKASDELIRLGFDYLYHGDIRVAMYRFNQAYLLDPKMKISTGASGLYILLLTIQMKL